MMTYHPHKILVTGGAGFIGANFIQYLLKEYTDINIVNVDLLTYAGSLHYLENVAHHPQYHFVQQTICDQKAIEKMLTDHHIDTIVHFAAESHVDRSIADPSVFLQTNVLGTYALLEAARNVWLNEKKWNESQCRFHHISTDEVFGCLKKDDPAFSESTPYHPNSPYSASKASSDHFVRAYHTTYGLPVTLSNCSNNYGCYQHQEKLIPTIIASCLKNKTIPIYGDGSNIRDWLYVVDHCVAIDKIIRQGKLGESYNIGGNEERTNLDLTRLICQMTAKMTHQDPSSFLKLIQFVADRPGHDLRYAINTTKIKNELEWKPQYNLTEGLRETIYWYLQSAFLNGMTHDHTSFSTQV